MKIAQSKKLIMLSSLFAIGSFYANCCGGPDDDDKELPVKLVIPGETPKSVGACFLKGFNKAVEKTTTKQFVSVMENITDSPRRWIGSRYAAMCKFAQFRNTTRILHRNDVVRLKDLMHQVLEHARANECDYDDYIVITKRVQECARYIEGRLRLAQSEYSRTLKGSRSVLQRAASIITSDYDVNSIIQLVEWMITDLEELYERSHYTKGFDIDHYKKVVCYLQADLDTLFKQLEEIV